ncbi:hypothetical protein BDZ94DRAFT_1316373 [Collybia nuda]|uniref:Uncharacterized protein n=1 Tax=Collybia nuda TaxID=64659 RepID=A0A9P5XTA5_9AGAR|nr:hypothetical protein BDZ94DRAFT_1316373 [Collybia nuda]
MSDISSIIDGLFFGYVVALILLGIIVVQFWIYLLDNNDTWAFRAFSPGLYFTETVSVTQLVHHYLISHYGDHEALKSPTDSVSVEFTSTNITFFLVHLFFANRLWKFGKSRYLPATIVFTSTTMLILGVSKY